MSAGTNENDSEWLVYDQNTIDFLFHINCKEIVINTHYKHKLINDFIKR